jgi:hypothetical protein
LALALFCASLAQAQPFNVLKHINTTTASSGISWQTVVGSTLFFTTNDRVTGQELWKTDGTAAGTVLV